MLASADNPSPSGKAASFVSLSGSKVQVEFGIIHRRLRLQALETACRDRHGDEGVRVMRLLLETGKMDEKQVKRSFPAALKPEKLIPVDLQSGHDGAQGLPSITVLTICGRLCQLTRGSSRSGSKPDQDILPLASYSGCSQETIPLTCSLGMLTSERHTPHYSAMRTRRFITSGNGGKRKRRSLW